MNKNSELKGILSKYFDWNKARLDCFAQMLLALIAVRTVNLREIAVAFKSKAMIDSRHKRIKRFFAHFKIDLSQVAIWVFKLFFSGDKRLYLTLDRTNWFWGKAKINVLTLAIAYEGIAIPIMWDLLDKAGNASAEEHKAILERFIKLFGKGCIESVLADREFGSASLFSWFETRGITFHIRIKENTQVSVFGGKSRCIERVFRKLGVGEQQDYPNRVNLYENTLYVAAGRSEKGELLIVATNRKPKHAIAIYLRRWEIETLFQSLKTRGFNFEATHITKLERIERLFALLTVAFCWAHKVGEWQAQKKSIRFNKYRESRRPQFSFFRYGLDCLRDVIFNSPKKIANFSSFLKCLPPILLTSTGRRS